MNEHVFISMHSIQIQLMNVVSQRRFSGIKKCPEIYKVKKVKVYVN